VGRGGGGGTAGVCVDKVLWKAVVRAADEQGRGMGKGGVGVAARGAVRKQRWHGGRAAYTSRQSAGATGSAHTLPPFWLGLAGTACLAWDPGPPPPPHHTRTCASRRSFSSTLRRSAASMRCVATSSAARTASKCSCGGWSRSATRQRATTSSSKRVSRQPAGAKGHTVCGGSNNSSSRQATGSASWLPPPSLQIQFHNLVVRSSKVPNGPGEHNQQTWRPSTQLLQGDAAHSRRAMACAPDHQAHITWCPLFALSTSTALPCPTWQPLPPTHTPTSPTHLVCPHGSQLLLLLHLHQRLLQGLAHQHLQQRLHLRIKVKQLACGVGGRSGWVCAWEGVERGTGKGRGGRERIQGGCRGPAPSAGRVGG
jgi:hypothetical protein